MRPVGRIEARPDGQEGAGVGVTGMREQRNHQQCDDDHQSGDRAGILAEAAPEFPYWSG